MFKSVVKSISLGDGLVTLFWEAGILRWQRRVLPHWYHPALDWLLRWPRPLLRLGAALEVVAACWLLRSKRRGPWER